MNGLKHCTFKHRIPLEKVSALSIDGNASILMCGFIHVRKRFLVINGLFASIICIIINSFEFSCGFIITFSPEMEVSFFVHQREEIFTDGQWNLYIYPIGDF